MGLLVHYLLQRFLDAILIINFYRICFSSLKNHLTKMLSSFINRIFFYLFE